MDTSMVVNEGCDTPLELHVLPDDAFAVFIDLYARSALGWNKLHFDPPRICAYCKDAEASTKGCHIDNQFMCQPCLTVCPGCNRYVCADHLERFANRQWPVLCRPCSERAYGKTYMEETDEMYHLKEE